jgi:tRNA(Ile)-lysidine synthase
MDEITYERLFSQLSSEDLTQIKKKLQRDILDPSPGSLIYKFIQHVNDFFMKHKLFMNGEKAFVALSGGADSVLLAIFLFYLKHKKLFDCVIALHVNHKTREECDKEEQFVKNLCLALDFECRVKKIDENLKLNSNSSNFEDKARKFRYKFFNENTNKSNPLYLGHQIDDSFEWWLMQSLKSSRIISSIGIPLVNKNNFRPLHCLTKSQIKTILKSIKFPWKEDLSNQSINYERNALRINTIKELSVKYPSYLKNFVERQNYQSKVMGAHRLQFLSNEIINKPFNITFNKGRMGEYLIYFKESDDLDLLCQEILYLIIKLSSKNRGKTRKQLDNLKNVILQKKFGPIYFSGGVQAFVNLNKICLVNDKVIKTFNIQDKLILKEMDRYQEKLTLGKDFYGMYLKEKEKFLKMYLFPYFFILESSSLIGQMKKKSGILRPDVSNRRMKMFFPEFALFVQRKGLLVMSLEDILRVKKMSKNIFDQLMKCSIYPLK